MTSCAELVNQLGNSTNDMSNDWPSASGSVASTETNYSTLDLTNVLQKQYSLIHKSYSEQMKKKKTVCCANEKTRPWMLRSMFLIVIALGLAISYFELRFSTYSPKTVILNTGDQLLLPLSTYLNKQVKLYTNPDVSDYVNLHVLRSKPNISSEVVSYGSAAKFRIPSWTFQYWGFYLLTGTSVRISVCADLQIQFYIIKGQKKLEKWTQEILYNGYDYHKNIFPKSSCNNKSNFKTHLLTVSSSDIYYILFSSSAGWRFLTEVYVLLQFNRTYYDMSALKYSCVLSNKSCSTYLDEGSMDISVLEVVLPNNLIHPFHTIKLRYVPIPRHIFYLKLFGGIYLSILTLSVIYIVWRMCVSATRSNTEKEHLVTSHHQHQQYSVINTDDKKWLVVSKISQISSKEAILEIDEKETKSLLEEESAKSFMIDSTSMYNNEISNYAYRNEYHNSQQLIDTCLTSAGASAI